MSPPAPVETGLLLSGGVDSAVLLDQLLGRSCRIVPFYVRMGCVWQEAELAAVKRFLASFNHPGLRKLVVLDMPVADLYGKHWSTTGANFPDNTSPDEAVFLPGRNPLLLIKPALWCAAHGVHQLAMATLASNPFDDATPEFFARFTDMIRVATGMSLEIARPFERFGKAHVLELGRELPLELTFSCLAPVGDQHCGCCNKCAERQRAFEAAGIDDRTAYANATSPSR